MSSITPLQKQVIERAKELIKNEKWFRGLCLDELMSDYEIEKVGIEEAAQDLAAQTAYWDAPNFL